MEQQHKKKKRYAYPFVSSDKMENEELEDNITLETIEEYSPKRKKSKKNKEKLCQELCIEEVNEQEQVFRSEEVGKVKKKKKKKSEKREDKSSKKELCHKEQDQNQLIENEMHQEYVDEKHTECIKSSPEVKKKKKKKSEKREDKSSKKELCHKEQDQNQLIENEMHQECVDEKHTECIKSSPEVKKKKKKKSEKREDKSSKKELCHKEQDQNQLIENEMHQECVDEKHSECIKSSPEEVKQKQFSKDLSIPQRPSYCNQNNTNFSESNVYFNYKKEEQKSRYPDLSEDISLRPKGRYYTISIAVPASILEETCLLQELRTFVIGQLARAACIYSVDEIIVYNDRCWKKQSVNSNEYIEEYMGMMRMILEYQECPQYLRKDLFPKHYYMRKAGVLNALNAPHHLLAYQWCSYREGVVLAKYNGKHSCVDVGLKSYVDVDRKLEPGLRVTVRFPPETKSMKKMYGYVVSPDEPRTSGGLYWGYTVRIADSLSEVFKSDRFEGNYDLIVGTSDKGDDVHEVSFKPFSHALIVFGGVEGIEAAMEADETLPETDPTSLFPYYLNVCPNQSSRTIRTEEAVLITLALLYPKLTAKGSTKQR